LFWDNTNGRLGVGGTPSTFTLDVNGTARISGNINSISTGLLTHSFFGATGYYALIGTSSSSGGYAEIYRPTSTKTLSINNGDFDLNLGVKFNYTGLFGILIKGATGNVLINTTTDAGFKLDVNGTARVNNALTIGSNQYLRAFRWTQDDVNRALTMESNSPYNFDSVNIISSNNNLLNNTKNILNLGLASTVSTQSSGSTDFFNVLNIPTTYNFTGGTHTVKGIYYNPTLTSMVGTTHYAFHSTSGRHRYENLPTSSAGLASGDLWNDAGTLKIV
jgi:hypothetical protein